MASTTFLWLLSLMTQKVEKNMFPGNYCSDGIVSLFAISGILASSISVQRSKKLILTVKIFGGAIFRFSRDILVWIVEGKLNIN